ncbi:MAG: hypothetical protein IT359_04060 [Gemmatimonadaceae bacterium]|nr:hypothetical protein [Gemmatimonadaceae bacterium]
MIRKLLAVFALVVVALGEIGSWRATRLVPHPAPVVPPDAAFDDKASVIGILEGVDLLLAQGFAPTRTVLLAFGAHLGRAWNQ